MQQRQEKQQQSNFNRLQAYRAKQSAEQRRRSELAEKVQRHAKQLNLSILHSAETVRLALNLLTIGFTDEKALAAAKQSADIIARTQSVSASRVDRVH